MNPITDPLRDWIHAQAEAGTPDAEAALRLYDQRVRAWGQLTDLLVDVHGLAERAGAVLDCNGLALGATLENPTSR